MNCVMDHIVLNVGDEDRMIEFYTEVLMLEPDRLDKYRAGEVPFPSVRLNPDTIIDLFPKKLWETVNNAGTGAVNLNHFCLCLDRNDWDSLLGRLSDYGTEIEVGPVSRWGAHGTGTSIYFRDPDNNLIEARYYDKPDGAEDCLLDS